MKFGNVVECVGEGNVGDKLGTQSFFEDFYFGKWPLILVAVT